MSEILDLIKKKAKNYLTADLNKVGYIPIYRSSKADSEGRYLAYILDDRNVEHYLYGQDVLDYIQSCYKSGVLKINGLTVLGVQNVSAGPPDWTIEESIYTTYNVATKEFVTTSIPVEEPTT